MKPLEHYLHDPEFQDFAVHQLAVGHIEHLITLFTMVKSGELPVIEAHAEVKAALKPLTSAEIQEFSEFIKSIDRLT